MTFRVGFKGRVHYGLVAIFAEANVMYILKYSTLVLHLPKCLSPARSR